MFFANRTATCSCTCSGKTATYRVARIVGALAPVHVPVLAPVSVSVLVSVSFFVSVFVSFLVLVWVGGGCWRYLH